MQQIRIFLNGNRDYQNITGDTGPCVYPAGFIYFYTFLYHLSGYKDIHYAQYIFMAIYMINLILVLNLYNKSKKVPYYAMLFISLTSYRIHSIYVLRLFNDTIAMLFLHLAINFLIYNKHSCASICISLALSIKMNILLYIPAYALIILLSTGIEFAILQFLIILLSQILIGLPFLLVNANSYVNYAFQFGRQFDYKWTVNWRFVPIEIFSNRRFHLMLLIFHFTTLVYFVFRCYLKKYSFKDLFKWRNNKQLSINDQLFALWTCNFIGIVFARSLHYQFYVWYYYSIPFMLWSINLPSTTFQRLKVPPKSPFESGFSFQNLFKWLFQTFEKDNLRLLIWGLIELSWNIYPSTTLSSLTLAVSHLIMLKGLATTNYDYRDKCD